MMVIYSMALFYATIFINSWVIFAKVSANKLSWKRVSIIGISFVIANMIFDKVILIDQLFFIIVSLLSAPKKEII